MTRLVQLLWALIIGAAATSTLLFVIQGGFAGGHGRFDRLIGILGFPWTLIPWPDAFFRIDFVPLVLLPFIINLVIVGTLTLLRWRRHGAR
jgi:hypothetical protein